MIELEEIKHLNVQLSGMHVDPDVESDLEQLKTKVNECIVALNILFNQNQNDADNNSR